MLGKKDANPIFAFLQTLPGNTAGHVYDTITNPPAKGARSGSLRYPFPI